MLLQSLLGVTGEKFDGVAANVVSTSVQTLLRDAAVVDQPLKIIGVTKGDKSVANLIGANPDITDARMKRRGLV